MGADGNGLTRRAFIGMTAAGAAAVSLGGTSALAATPKRGGTAVCGMPWMIQTPDPHRYSGTWGRHAFALAWEGLFSPIGPAERMRIIQEEGEDKVPEVKPMLAESWEVEKGGARYVIHLKKGVKFHNGKELDAMDIKWNWERIKDPKHIALIRNALTKYLASVETPDPYTVVANLDRPYAAFLLANTWVNTPIIPKESIPWGVIWGVTPTFKPPTVAPPGTGPFKMVEYQQKNQAVYEAHRDYRVPGLPYLDRVIYKVITQDSPRTMALRAGDVQYAFMVEKNWLQKVMSQNMDKVHQIVNLENEGVNLFPIMDMRVSTLYVNCHEKMDTPFKDARVRQALDFCIDREKLANALMGNLGVPMYQGYHPDLSPWGFRDIQGRKRDVEKAKKLLKEAGYPDGLDVDIYVTGEGGVQPLMAQIVQQMSAPAGFRLKIAIESGVQYWSRLRTYKYHLFRYLLYKEDPMQMYYDCLHTDPAPPYNGYSAYLGVQDSTMDQLLDDMAGEIDFKKRKAKFKEVVLEAIEQAYFIPLYLDIRGDAWSKKLKNFHPERYYYSECAFREAWLDT